MSKRLLMLFLKVCRVSGCQGVFEDRYADVDLLSMARAIPADVCIINPECISVAGDGDLV
jgi:hypothetical protein